MKFSKCAALFTVVLLVSTQNCSGYKCYICSWSPRSENRTDICTTTNFNEMVVNLYDGCIHGCEAVAVYNTNGKLENFYRNCLVKGKKVHDECRTEESTAYKKRSCRCAADLCNSAGSAQLALTCLVAAALASVLQMGRG